MIRKRKNNMVDTPLYRFVSGLTKTEREMQWRMHFTHDAQQKVLSCVMGDMLLEPLSKRYRLGHRHWTGPGGYSSIPCIRDVLNYFFACYKKQQNPVKKEMYQFVAAMAPEVFDNMAIAMKQKIDNNNDKKNIHKSLVTKWLASKVNKRISVICVNVHGLRVIKVLKVERVTSKTAYIWRFDLPTGDDANVLVRFNICRGEIYENGFRNALLDGGMVVKMPTSTVLERVYKKTTTEALLETMSLSKNTIDIVVGFLKFI